MANQSSPTEARIPEGRCLLANSPERGGFGVSHVETFLFTTGQSMIICSCSFTDSARSSASKTSKSCVPFVAGKTAGRPQERFPCRTSGTQFLSKMNRAASGGNAPLTGGQSRRLDLITGPLEKMAGSICYLPSAVNRAGVTARGFVWLTVSQEIPKAPNLVRKKRAIQRSKPESGLLWQPTLNRRSYQFNKRK